MEKNLIHLSNSRVCSESTLICPAVTPCTCTDLHRVWVCNIDDGELEFVYHFNNHLNPFRSFLLLLVVKWKTLSFSVYSSIDRTRLRGIALSNDSKDLVVTKFKLTVVHVTHPNPMLICACAWIYRWTKNCGKSGLGRGPAFSKTPLLTNNHMIFSRAIWNK